MGKGEGEREGEGERGQGRSEGGFELRDPPLLLLPSPSGTHCLPVSSFYNRLSLGLVPGHGENWVKLPSCQAQMPCQPSQLPVRRLARLSAAGPNRLCLTAPLSGPTEPQEA